MKNNYSFLKDDLALMEIRKHKWLRSEKERKEVGFATAALEWINKFGEDWLRSRYEQEKSEDFFAEKRNFRRFNCRLPLEIRINNKKAKGISTDINLFALSCTADVAINEKEQIEATIDFSKVNDKFIRPKFQFSSRAMRVTRINANKSDEKCKLVIPFDEKTRDFLRCNLDVLSGLSKG